MADSKYKCFAHINNQQIHNLMKCMAICKACACQCIETGNKKIASLCHECAEVCNVALKLKCFNSEFSHQCLELCHQICKKCAEECKKIECGHCQECADMCKACCASCCTTGCCTDNKCCK